MKAEEEEGSYPDPMEPRVVVEQLHLLRRKRTQNLLNGEELRVKTQKPV